MVSENFSFPPELKLSRPIDYQRVFRQPVKSTDKFFTILAVQNEFDHPRLGLAIAKKNIKKAVKRNLIKRAVRENFRLQQQQLINIDIVVLARRDAAHASPVILRKSLDRHWLKLSNRCVAYS